MCESIVGGMLLLELNRLLRPGGYFVWCATPVYQKIEEDAHIWNGMIHANILLLKKEYTLTFCYFL